MGLGIDLYCNDGSPLGLIPDDIYGRGVGGAELAMMSWAETMAERGHRVRVYNSPRQRGSYEGVGYLPQAAFSPGGKRDVLIAYRSPNVFMRRARAGFKIHWSCDQYTVGNFATDVFPFVDKVVCISPYHVDYHRRHYGIAEDKIGHFDLGVRLDDYDLNIDKIPGRCIFCSVPDRGLDLLYELWPAIKAQAPHASLVITADYRLWGAPSPGNHQHRLKWLGLPDVVFLGKVPRQALVREQLAAVCQPYPCTYEELFCISAAECQVAGARPVTSQAGALVTTNAWGRQVDLARARRHEFVEAVVEALDCDPDETKAMRRNAWHRFNWHRICAQWETLIETGSFSVAQPASPKSEVRLNDPGLNDPGLNDPGLIDPGLNDPGPRTKRLSLEVS